jgi:hypothetical protein
LEYTTSDIQKRWGDTMQVLSKTMLLLALITLLLGACEFESDPDCGGFRKDVVVDVNRGAGVYEIEYENTDAAIANLENIECISGSLSISHTMLDSLSGLDSLKKITGSLYIWDNAALASLNGLNNLTSVVEDLTIRENGALPQCIVDEFAAGVTFTGTPFITPNGSTDPGLCP